MAVSQQRPVIHMIGMEQRILSAVRTHLQV